MPKKAENNPAPTQGEPGVKIVKKKGGCGFFAGFFSCILLIVLVIGGFGLYVYNAVTINQVESLLGVKLPVEGDIRNKPVKDLITLALETKDSYVHMTINDLPEKVGVDLPTTIPGTDIQLEPIYDAEIVFLNATIKVRDAEIMDVANNIDAFVDAVLPVFYDTVKVGELLTSLDMDQTITEMGYPALTEAIYNVGTQAQPNFKALNDLTINQAKDVLVNYYGEENLTIQGIINAIGLQDVIPDPEAGSTDIYAGLRDLVIAEMSTEDILSNITGAILAEHIDLSEYRFTLREGFRESSILDLPDYIQTVPLSDLIDVPASTGEATNPTLRLMYALRNATLDNFMAEDVITSLADLIDSENGWQNFTLGTLLNKNTLGNIQALCDVKFTDLLKDSENTIDTLLKSLTLGDMVTINNVTASDFFEQNPEFSSLDGVRYSRIKPDVKELKVNQILTLAQISTAGLNQTQQNLTLYGLMGYDFNEHNDNTRTLKDIISPSILQEIGGFAYLLRDSTILSINEDYNSLTVQQILGEDNELSQVVKIADITVYTLLNDEDALNIIMDEFGTLGEMCDSNTGIFAIIGDIAISDLLDDPDVIMNTIKSSDKTLADLLEISAPTGIMAEIAGITVGDLFTDANQAINNALESSTTTLGSLLELDNPTGIMSIVANITIGDLLTDPDAITDALTSSSMTLAELLDITDTTGIMSIIKNVTVGELFNNASTAITSALKNSNMTLASLIGLSNPTGMIGTITRSVTVADLFGDDPTKALSDAIDSVEIADFFGSVDPSEKVLYALVAKNRTKTIANINTAISGLRLADILGCYTYNADGSDNTFTAPTSGIFALLSQTDLNTTINNIDGLDVDLANTTISRLIEVGLLTGDKWTNGPFNQNGENKNTALASVTVNEILIYAIDYDCDQDDDKKVDAGYTGVLLADFIASRTSSNA